MSEDKKSWSERAEERSLQALGELKTPLPEVFKVQTKVSRKSVILYIPLLILSVVLTALFVSWSFGWVSFEHLSTPELLSKLTDPRAEIRRMAATDWAGQLLEQSNRYEISGRESDLQHLRTLSPDAEQSVQLANIVAHIGPSDNLQTVGIDPKWGASLFVILSFSIDQDAARTTIWNFLKKHPVDQKVELQFYALMALGRTGLDFKTTSAQFLEELTQFFESRSQSTDLSIKKALALVLGQSKGIEAMEVRALPILRQLITQSDAEVRLNAALSLLRLGQNDGHVILASLVHEIDAIDSNKIPMSLLDRSLTGIRGIAKSRNPEFQSVLSRWANEHANFKIRDLCKKMKY